MASSQRGDRRPRSTRTRRLLDGLQYAVALAALVAAVSTVVGVALAGVDAAAVAAKYGLFLGGTVHLGYATVLAWVGSRAPALSNNGIIARVRSVASSDDRDERAGTGASLSLGDDGDLAEPSGLQRLIRRAPPTAWYPVRARDRISDTGRLFLASGAMFLASFLSEAAFGVAL
ncbi:hypothetical protein [Halobaculum sp. MBLA0143]|uniref:DUF7555 family protein n=1 Tax=Halobaculum sp. MBLA0143 TaxID=3079933 RepID=UPI003525FFD5